jgi:hypothetical protein
MDIIHDWADPEAIRVLQAVRRACPPHAKLLVLENVLPETPEPHWTKLLDITMLVTTGGLERTRHEYERLLSSARFRLDRVVETPPMGLPSVGIFEASAV